MIPGSCIYRTLRLNLEIRAGASRESETIQEEPRETLTRAKRDAQSLKPLMLRPSQGAIAMKRYPFLLHGAWALLAAGAWLAGSWHSRPGDSASHSGPSAGSMAGPVSAPRPAAAGAAASGSPVSRWLHSLEEGGAALSPERMTELARAALRDPDPVKATLYFTHLLEKLTPENAPALLQAINDNVRGPEANRFLTLLAHAWGTKDGAAAIAAIEALKRRDLDGVKGSAMAAWAAGQSDQALNWLQKRAADPDAFRDSRGEQALLRGLVSGMARRDMDGALAYVMTLKEDQRGEFAHLLAEQKLKESVASGAEFALRLPEERMRTNALETVGYQYIREDLPAAAQWAEKIAARPDAHEAVADIAAAMAHRDGKAAAAWAARLPAGESQNHAMEDIYETWTPADPLAASQSLNEMERGPGRDAAIQAFSRTLAGENPADAVTWAGAISDERERIDVQVDIARRWQTKDPAEARAWIVAHLPPDAQARALTPRR
jgi:hypothetical protein